MRIRISLIFPKYPAKIFRGSSREKAVLHPLTHVLVRESSPLFEDFVATPDEQKGGHGPNHEELGGDRIGVSVDFHDLDFAGKVLSQLIHERVHHFAGSTPGSPEIDDDRDGVRLAEDDLGIVLVGCFLDPTLGAEVFRHDKAPGSEGDASLVSACLNQGWIRWK
jgi:hypothetical protein